ncbi:hypothetical protein LWI28_019436 [Acer negundo]|uniref:F-box domain-containing protein n=1 Tax=Acer negundo TaxID=4023 RepID=A0AAD5IUW0_ACENE|nr:hypothetical protein LWI28_019436 [Acer negundo]
MAVTPRNTKIPITSKGSDDDDDDRPSSLPEPIINHIFSFLETIDVIRASLVCRKWRWMNVLARRKVQRLDLKLLSDTPMVLPRCIVNCESLLDLKICFYRCCALKLPEFPGFTSLKSLNLCMVEFSDSVLLAKFVSSCPVLESLIMHNCNFLNFKILDITASRLRNLTINVLAFRGDGLNCEVIVACPSLVSFNLLGSPSGLSFIDTKSIHNVSLYFDCPPDPYHSTFEESRILMNNVLKGICNVKALKLSPAFLEFLLLAVPDQECFSASFYNLKSLYVTMDEYDQSIIRLLNCSPNLEVLSICLKWWDCWSDSMKLPNEDISCLTYHLRKILEISSTSLKNLIVDSGDTPEPNSDGLANCEVKVACPSLVSFNFITSSTWNFTFQDLNSLQDVFVYYDYSPDQATSEECHYVMSKFLKGLRNVQRLKLSTGFQTGCELLKKYKKRTLGIFFFVLEGISVLLDQLGRSKLVFLFAAFVLSEIGFAVTLYTSIKARISTRSASAPPVPSSENQLVAVEVVFSVIQLIATFTHFILAVLNVKNNYDASIFPIAFAMIAVAFAFRKDHNEEEITNNFLFENSAEGYHPINTNPVSNDISDVLVKTLADFVHKPTSSRTSFVPMSSHTSFVSSTSPDHDQHIEHNYRLQKIEVQLTGTYIEIKYIDLTELECYADLFTELVEIFNIAGELWGPKRKWDVFYLDIHYNIRVLLGDISWEFESLYVPNGVKGFAGMAFASIANVGSLRSIIGGSSCNLVDRFPYHLMLFSGLLIGSYDRLSIGSCCSVDCALLDNRSSFPCSSRFFSRTFAFSLSRFCRRVVLSVIWAVRRLNRSSIYPDSVIIRTLD